MILVTGASGNTGLRVLEALVARGARTRAFVGRQASLDKVLAAGAVDALAGSLRDSGDVERAMRGVSAVYHVCPPMSDAEVEIGGLLIAAAERNGARRFVFHSLVHAQVEDLAHHRDKRAVERLLRESRLDYTVLQPAMYMQNLAWEWKAVLSEGVYRQPYSPDVTMSLVDLDDVAEAAAIVLTEPGWGGGCFELCSGDNLTRSQMAVVLAEALGRPVRAERGNREAWIAQARQLGTRTEFQIARVLAMFDYYDRHGLAGGNQRVLEMILGRKPRDFRQFAQAFARDEPAPDESATRGTLSQGPAASSAWGGTCPGCPVRSTQLLSIACVPGASPRFAGFGARVPDTRLAVACGTEVAPGQNQPSRPNHTPHPTCPASSA